MLMWFFVVVVNVVIIIFNTFVFLVHKFCYLISIKLFVTFDCFNSLDFISMLLSKYFFSSSINRKKKS